MKRFFIFLFCWFHLFCICHIAACKETPIPSLSPFITSGGYALQVENKVVRSNNLDKQFIPASTIKVLTSLLALEILGPEYRFATRVYIDKQNRVYIAGEGDPMLTSEAIRNIAAKIKSHGIDIIRQIILDDSAFTLEGPPPGSTNTHNPYDAHSGALAVNFNALPFKVLNNGKVVTSEKQTPTLPLMVDIGRGYSMGSYRVNVSAYTAFKDHSNILRYSGELFTEIFREEGIQVTEGYSAGQRPDKISPLFVYESTKTVAELVRLCLYYSSNFIANQLYLSCGRRIYNGPATWLKAQKTTEKYLQLRLKMPPGEIHMVDGSGLSDENRISPASMLKLLNKFRPYVSLMKKRDAIYLKSGTLTGTYSYVGYFVKEGNLSPYVLFLNQKRNTRKTVLKLMKNEFDIMMHSS